MSKPIIFTRTNIQEEEVFQEYCRLNNIFKFIDEYSEAREELENLHNPKRMFSQEKEVILGKKEDGVWVCFPWKNSAVHTLHKKDYRDVRLSRNNDLITQDEQKALSHKKISIAGLNVGNPGALCMIQEGIGGYFRFADNDKLGLSNLNRFRAGLCDVGLNKAILSAHQAYEIDPFVEISIYENGVSNENLTEFLSDTDLLVEEMDNLPLKITAREIARERRIPTIMVTGNGSGLILDVERYDLDRNLDILSGHLDPYIQNAIKGAPKNPKDRIILARDFMGKTVLTKRLYDSFQKIGDTLIGIPQLAEASFLRGAVLANVARAILTGEHVPSGRYSIQLSDIWRKNDQ